MNPPHAELSYCILEMIKAEKNSIHVVWQKILISRLLGEIINATHNKLDMINVLLIITPESLALETCSKPSVGYEDIYVGLGIWLIRLFLMSNEN